MDAPLLLMARPFRRDEVVRDARNAAGQRVKLRGKRSAHDGEIRVVETVLPEGNQDAVMRPPHVKVTLSARQFGLTQRQLAECIARTLNARPRRSPGGLHLP